MTPQRIQLSRRRGYRKPEGAIVVARPTKWGNPFHWTDYPSTVTPQGCDEPVPVSDEQRRRDAVTDFRAAVVYGIGGAPAGYPPLNQIRAELAGHDLACWCPLDHPCHADVLLAIANGDDHG